MVRVSSILGLFPAAPKGKVTGLWGGRGGLVGQGRIQHSARNKLPAQSFSNREKSETNTRQVRNPVYRANISSFQPSQQRSSKSETKLWLCRCLLL